MDARAFYDPSHHRDLFGATAGRANPHRGLDIGGIGAGAEIPSWCAGVVVVSEWNDALGWVVAVQLPGPNGYAGHSHLLQRGLPVGTQVWINSGLGLSGDTGSQSSGPHDHVTWSADSPYPWTGSVADPWPRIQASVFGSTPAGLPTDPTEDPIEEETMQYYFIATSNGPEVLVGSGDVWVWVPGVSPYTRITQAQWNTLRLDFNSPRVFSISGAALEQAIKEQPIADTYTSKYAPRS